MNDPLDLALSGAQDMANGQKSYWDDIENEKQRNKPLSAYEKWLGKVMSGELSPEQAGIAAKLEAQGHPAFAQSTSPGPQMPQQGQPPARSYEPTPGAYGYQPNYQGSPSPMMQQGQGLSAPTGGPNIPYGLGASQNVPPEYQMPRTTRTDMNYAADARDPNQAPGTRVASAGGGLGAMEPQTRGDFQSMIGVAPLIKNKREKSPQEIQLELLKEQGRMNRNERTNSRVEGVSSEEWDRKSAQFDQELRFKKQALSQHLQETMLKLENRLQVAMHARSSNEKIALLKTLVSDANGAERNVAEIMKSDPYLSKDEAAHEEVYNARNRTYNIRNQATELLKQMQGNVGQTTSTGGSVTLTKPPHTPESLNALFGK